MAKIFTAGHSNRSIEEFIELLDTRGIALVVDARSIPFSKANPQFNRPTLAHALSRVGIDYLWRGKNIGGLVENMDQEEAVKELVRLADEVPLAVMCSEADYHDCHRYSVLTPLFEAEGAEVEHIEWENKAQGNLFAGSSNGRTPSDKDGDLRSDSQTRS